MTNKEWLASLQVGDEVAVFGRPGNEGVQAITHQTKTTVAIGGVKFRRKDGFQIGGDSWSTYQIAPPTERLRKRALYFGALSRLSEAARQPAGFDPDSIVAAANELRPLRAVGRAA